MSVDFLETICRHEFFQSNSLGIFALIFLLADFLAEFLALLLIILFSFFYGFKMCQTFLRTVSLSLDILKLVLLNCK